MRSVFWLAIAAGVACGAVALAIAAGPFPSTVLAVIGLPLAAYAAVASLSRPAMTLSLAALAADLLVLGYWVYAFFDLLEGAR